MNKLTLLLLSLVFVFNSCSTSSDDPTPEAEKVYEGSMLFFTQTFLDEFALENYTEITGDVTITGSTQDPITSLSGLSRLKKIGGKLIINENSSLIDLTGLENLESVNDLTINKNSSLRSLKGLENLTDANFIFITTNSILDDISLNKLNKAGLISIFNNNFLNTISMPMLSEITVEGLSIVDFNGNALDFTSLKDIVGGLYLSNMPNVTTVSGFKNLETASSHLTLDGFTSLKNLDGFSSLSTVGDFSIESFRDINNTNILTSIDIPSLKTINGSLYLLDCNISTISMSNLETIGGKISYANMSELETINFPSLTSLGALETDWGSNFKTIRFPKLTTVAKSGDIYEGDTFIKIDALNINEIDFSLLERIDGDLILRSIQSGISLEGFDQLQEVKNIDIGFNFDLTSINTFGNLIKVNDLSVQNNSTLSDLCGLQNVAVNGTISGVYTVEGNSYNPTKQDLIDGSCSN